MWINNIETAGWKCFFNSHNAFIFLLTKFNNKVPNNNRFLSGILFHSYLLNS